MPLIDLSDSFHLLIQAQENCLANQFGAYRQEDAQRLQYYLLLCECKTTYTIRSDYQGQGQIQDFLGGGPIYK